VVEQKHSKPGKGLTWWWNDDVESAVKEKRKLWKVWKKGGLKEPYLAANG